jgi:calcium-translocating P-type ATPase
MSTSQKYYEMDNKSLEEHFKTSLKDGLTEEKAKEILLRDGKNSLGVEKKKSFLEMIVDELKAPLTFTLLIAGILTTMLSHYIDATVIFFALVINVIINLYQNKSASNAFETLKASAAEHSIVVRDGVSKQILAEDLVIGDIILLQTGVSVPSDARIIDSYNAEVNESSLTGEWLPIAKHAIKMDGVFSYVEQKNMIFMGTQVLSGSLRAVVVATGEKTVFGKIGQSLKIEVVGGTPMQKNTASITKLLLYIISIALVIVLIMSLLRSVPFVDTLLMLVAIGVAAIPEGLPAAVSVILAFSMKRILKKGGLVRNLLAAETLGSTTVIMTDKTGTLTEGIMHIDRIVCHSGLDENGVVYSSHKRHEEHGDERDSLNFAFLATNVIVENSTNNIKESVYHGLPVEVAVARAFYSSGMSENELNTDFKRIAMAPFSNEARMVFSLNELHGLKQNRLFVLGASEEVLRHAKSYYEEGKAHPMGSVSRKKFEDAIEAATRQGVRVVAVGYIDNDKSDVPDNWQEIHDNFFIDTNFVFCALIYLTDPLREDVRRSISIAKAAGVRVIMTTGDNPNTARTIAINSGIISDKEARVITGVELEEMTDVELEEALTTVRVFARVLPEHKQRIGRILTEKGEVVAMTGDGVNDAPALHGAAIGVALGSGTDIAKEASDLVLLDNSFSVIVVAIEEGRRAVDNIRKSVVYLLSTSFSEVVLIITALMIGATLPLLPVQIIWTNMLTEGFMNFAFAFEKTEKGAMSRNPKIHGAEHMLNRRYIGFIVSIGAIVSAILVTVYLALQSKGIADVDTRTIMFVLLTMTTSFIALSLRDLRNPIWASAPWTNKYLMLSLLLTLSGLAVALFITPISKILSLNTSAIIPHIGLIVAGVLAMFVGVELSKMFIFKKG